MCASPFRESRSLIHHLRLLSTIEANRRTNRERQASIRPYFSDMARRLLRCASGRATSHTYPRLHDTSNARVDERGSSPCPQRSLVAMRRDEPFSDAAVYKATVHRAALRKEPSLRIAFTHNLQLS